MSELFPVLAGLAVGTALAILTPRRRRAQFVAALAAVVLGTTATIVSGEFRIGWEYLLVDIPLVALSALLAMAVVLRLRAITARRPLGRS